MNTATINTKPELEPQLDVEEGCSHCGSTLCQREIVFNLALGYEDAYSCIFCLAKEKKQPVQELFNYLLRYIQTRPCYMIMWEKSRRAETKCSGCQVKASC